MGGRNESLPTRVNFRDVEDDEFRGIDAGAAVLPERIGGFAIVRRLGIGGMGTVYEAKQDRPERAVALKVMRSGLGSKQLERRFEREAEVLARLSHPCIAKVYCAGTHVPGKGSEYLGPVPFIALEYVRGARSITKFATEERLSRVDRVRLFLKVCDAIHYGHESSVLHRDLKPDNILVDEAGEPKVIDFGVARVLGGPHESGVFRTEMGQILGTVQYMSPEQCAADPAQVDARSDVYSLGVVLYELLTGELPYDVRNVSVYEAIKRVQESNPKSPSSHDPTLDRDLDVVVETSIAKVHDRRYASVRALADDLQRWLASEPIAARPQSRAQRLRRFARRNRALSALAGALLLVTISSAGAIASLHSKVNREHVARVEAERNADAIRSDAEDLRGQLRQLASVGASPMVFPTLDPGADSKTFERAFDSARASLEKIDVKRCADSRLSVVVADSYELVGDVLARTKPLAAEEQRIAWSRSLEIQREALRQDADDVLVAVCPKDRPRPQFLFIDPSGAGARFHSFVWRLPQREGELLSKLGHTKEARAALRAAFELCSRAYAEDPRDADIREDLAAIAAQLERFHREAGEPQIAALYTAEKEGLLSSPSPERLEH